MALLECCTMAYKEEEDPSAVFPYSLSLSPSGFTETNQKAASCLPLMIFSGIVLSVCVNGP